MVAIFYVECIKLRMNIHYVKNGVSAADRRNRKRDFDIQRSQW